jgi:nitrogen-specific signal transduction histidine kinase
MMELARPATMHREPVNLNELLTQVFELYEGQASAQSIKFVREYDADLPSVWPTENVPPVLGNIVQWYPGDADRRGLTVRTARSRRWSSQFRLEPGDRSLRSR